MENNVVFQNQNLGQNSNQQTGEQVVPSSQPPLTPPLPPPPPSMQNPLENNNQDYQEEKQKSFFNLKTILKIFLGLAVLVIIGFLIIKFLLPIFSSPKSENVTLTYWGLWEDQKAMQGIISEFEKENPNIKIEYSKQDAKQYRERLITRSNNNTGPDIFRFHNTWYPMLSDLLVPVPTDVISSNDFKKTYYTVMHDDLIKNGAIYGIPLGIDTLALYINTDVFSTAGIADYPKTWEDFIEAARRLTVKDESGKIKTAGAAMGTFDNINHAPDIISLLFLQNGVNFLDINSTVEEAADALGFYTKFAQDEGNIWDDTLDNSILAFAKENLVMCFGYSWDAFTIKAINPDLKYKVVPVPQLIAGKVAIASYWVEGVSQKSKHQKEALQFLKFLAKKETSEKLFTEQSKTRLYGEPYARLDLADKLKENELVFPFVQQGVIARSSYFVDSTHDEGLNTKANEYLGIAVNSILKNTSSDTAAETLVKGVSQVLQQYGQ